MPRTSRIESPLRSRNPAVWLRFAQVHAIQIRNVKTRAEQLATIVYRGASAARFRQAESTLRVLQTLLNKHPRLGIALEARLIDILNAYNAGFLPYPPVVKRVCGDELIRLMSPLPWEIKIERFLRKAESCRQGTNAYRHWIAEAVAEFSKNEINVPTSDRAHFTERLVKLYARHRKFAEALNVAATLERFSNIDKARLEYQAGKLRAFTKTLRAHIGEIDFPAIMNCHHTIRGFCQVAQLQSELGQTRACQRTLKAATKFAVKVESSRSAPPWALVGTFGQIAVQVQKLGDTEAARVLIQKAELWARLQLASRGCEDEKRGTSRALVEFYRDMSCPAEALRHAMQVEDIETKQDLLARLLADMGRYEELRDLFRKCRSPEKRTELAVSVALHLER